MSGTDSKRSRESTWLVIRRCLALLRRVQQGPAKKQDLLDAVYAAEGEEAYGNRTGKLLNKRFEDDKRRLWQRLGVRIRYRGEVGGYKLDTLERPLLDLPDEHLETLAFLADTFQPDSPHASQVRQLIETLLSWLADDRRRVYERARGLLPDIDLRLRDSDEIATDVWETVLAAHNNKQQLEFDYLSSRHADKTPRHHVVEPWDVYFSDRGHYVLHAYCLFRDGLTGPGRPNRYLNYRLSRIVPDSAKMLPKKLPATPRAARPYDVIYELSPRIARFGVSRRPELVSEPEISRGDDGWVRVEGKTHDVFHLARNLLYYGANCRVLGGRELLQEVRQLVQELAEIYR
jgi:predicted DNA-binding transcriptional regulator YafY